MKTIILISILALSLNLTGQEYGYLLVVDTYATNQIKSLKTLNIDLVDDIIKNRTGIKVDSAKLLSGKNYFYEYRDSKVCVYVEKKRIIRKKNGKIRFRKIK